MYLRKKSKTHERIKLFILAYDMCAGYWLGIGDVPRSGRRLFCDNDWCNFLVPSLISIIGYYAQAAEVRRRFPVEGVGSLLFGLWLIIMPGFFADLLTFVLGFILVMGGVQQIASLSAARRWTPVPGGFYVVPVLILLAGLIALFNPTGVRSTAFIIIGITSLVYAVSELINWFKFTRLRPKAPVAGDKTSDVDIEDAKIIE